MRRRQFLALAAALLIGGCSGATVTTSSTKHPNQFTKAELEADVGRRLKLTDVSLTEGAKGEYTGTGKGANDRVYEVKVTVTDHSMKWNKLFRKDGETDTEGGSESW
jgi:uncharacterized protein with FMN-binding domain